MQPTLELRFSSRRSTKVDMALYSVDTSPANVVIRFQTSRLAWLLAAAVASAVLVGVFLFAMRMDWNSDLLSGVFGGCFGLIAVIWFAAAPHLTRYVLSIEHDIVSFRREFYGIPVGRSKLFTRSAVTDLGVYPIDGRGSADRSQLFGTLCVWVNGKSIELEPYFPIQVGVALARDLEGVGIAFPRNYDQLNEERLMFGRSRYLSF